MKSLESLMKCFSLSLPVHSFHLGLTHTGNPKFLDVPKQQNVTENTTGFILCPVDRGYPEAIVRWCKNGRTVVSGPRINVTHEGLQITDVKPEDAGDYTCSLFRNGWGANSTTVSVQVLSGNTGGECIASSVYLDFAMMMTGAFMFARYLPRSQVGNRSFHLS